MCSFVLYIDKIGLISKDSKYHKSKEGSNDMANENLIDEITTIEQDKIDLQYYISLWDKLNNLTNNIENRNFGTLSLSSPLNRF